MTDDEIAARGADEDRVALLLRRAGPVETAPPPGLWDALRDELARPWPGSRRTGGSGRRRGAPDRWRAAPLLLAAAVGAGVMWVGSALTGDDLRPSEGEVVLASGSLAPLDGAGQVGTAEVVTVADRQVLRVELTELPDPQDGYLEVWLLRPDVSGMLTLGVIDGSTAEFVLPASTDLQEYPVVDISREHLDGDPAHGGDSLVRGEIG